MKLGKTDIYWGSCVDDRTRITWGHPQQEAQGAGQQQPDGADLDELIWGFMAVPLAIGFIVAYFVGAALVIGLFLRIVLSVL
jgi:hypothetical protein